MRADSQVIRQEAREVLQDALLSYPGDDLHVAVYVAARDRPWNELQADLSRIEDVTSDSERVRRIRRAVREHLDQCLRDYLGIE